MNTPAGRDLPVSQDSRRWPYFLVDSPLAEGLLSKATLDIHDGGKMFRKKLDYLIHIRAPQE
jgi:hypothetical protein